MKESDFPIRELDKKAWPPLLNEIPDKPETLFYRGNLPENKKLLCVVGSRKYTSYGKQVVETLISDLAGTNTCIVSGLALGIDAIAHQAALNAGLQTLAIPGSGLSFEVLYPRTNLRLAQEILASGGGLLSEFENNERARPEYFPQRNRIMAGMSHATLVIEAGERSGTLITARLAMEYNRDVCVVPADIFRTTSHGSNLLLKNGAFPITTPDDLFEVLDIKKEERGLDEKDLSEDEIEILKLLHEPQDKQSLFDSLPYEMTEINVLLSSMEIKGLIKEELGKVRKA